jgi:RNA polymerase sigma-70 factor, ECF subfamily
MHFNSITTGLIALCESDQQVRNGNLAEFQQKAIFSARLGRLLTFTCRGHLCLAERTAERARCFWRKLSTDRSLAWRGRIALPSHDSQDGSQKPDENLISDRSLLRRVRGGDNDAATEIYLRYARRLEFLAQKQCSPELAARFDPEDVVQSVFRTFFRRAERGDYVVPDGEELWKLLLVIAMNKIRANGAFHRAAKRDVRLTLSGKPVEESSAQDQTALTVLRMVVEQVLEGLSATHRKIVELRIEGHEVAEIAERTGRAKRSVERLLQEFRKALSAQIEVE